VYGRQSERLRATRINLRGDKAMDVRLTLEEEAVLIELLEERDRALLDEIAHASQDTPRKLLKEQEELLEALIEKLEVERKAEQSFSDLWW